MDGMDPCIVVSNVSKTFRRYHADRPSTLQETLAQGWRRRRRVERFWGLKDINFSIERGKTVGIIGSNGSGKSTLLRLIGGVGKPDEGRIAVYGRLGALLDLGAGFHPDLTGRENAMLAGILNGLTRKQVLQRLESIVDFAEIEAALDNPIRTYSSGMQMRLAFSVAVHTEPEILLIDEVLSVGDMSFQKKCLDRIAQFKANGCSILLVSHVGRTVERLCDEAIWLNKGQLMVEGPTADVVKRYAEHMGVDPASQAAPAGVEDPATVPVKAAPKVAVRTPRGKEVLIDETRFGSLELEIRQVRVLDATGQPVTRITSGQPLHIELEYVAAELLTAPIFCVRIDREDDLMCYSFNAVEPPMNMLEIQGPGKVGIHLDRVDLNTGKYYVTVACFAQDWAYAYDHQKRICSFEVQGSGVKDAILNVPHQWELHQESNALATTQADSTDFRGAGNHL